MWPQTYFEVAGPHSVQQSLYHVCQTMRPSGMLGLSITPVAAQVSFVLRRPGAVLANTMLPLHCC